MLHMNAAWKSELMKNVRTEWNEMAEDEQQEKEEYEKKNKL